MKKNPVFTLLLLLIQLYLLAADSDTTIQGVNVQFKYDSSIFPESWRVAPINAQGENIAPEEISRTQSIMLRALDKYPEVVLQANLKAVYFLKGMKYYDVGFGGTNSNDALFLTNNGIDLGYTDAYLEQTFHHEFSSILFRNFPSLLDTISWKNANIPGYDYNDPEAGVGAIRNNQSSQDADTELCKKGFLTQYALSSLENDLNTLAQNLFRPGAGFWSMVDSYPRIRKKVSLLIIFYFSINPQFTEQYFRKFETP
jgi:hypothetical protein